MNNKSCFFIGHREASTEILPALESAIEQHISEYGVTEFIVGGYGGFDRLAASAVIRAKRQHPQITLVLLLPYHPAERPIENRKVLTVPIILRTWKRCPVALQLSEQTDMWWIMLII